MNNCKNMDKKCEYADRLGMCENLTATCTRKRTMSEIDASIKLDAMRRLVKALETVDVVPVVRCKDCKFYEKERECNLLHVFMLKMDDWFCAYGERRDPCSSQDS